MNKITVFIALLILSLSSSAQIGLPVQPSLLPKNNLVVNYDFSKSTGYTRGSTTATNLAGTASGNPTLYSAPIFINSLGYISFNGSTQYLATPDIRTYFKTANASAQKSVTISFWFYPLTTTGVLVSELDSQNPSQGWHASNIEIINGFIKYRIWNGPIVTSKAAVNLNQWHHIALVYDGTSVKGYLNGVLQGTQAGAREIPPSSQYYALGAGEATNMGSGAYGNFHLSQLKIYNLPLSDKEIQQDYELRKTEFDYTIHSPSTNSNPSYWSVSSAWNSVTGASGASDVFTAAHYTPWLNSGLGWVAQAQNTSQWIILNYDAPVYINGIVTQSRANGTAQWVKKGHIEYSLNGTDYTRLISNQVINTNTSDDNYIKFSTPVFAKYVKLIPTEWNDYISVRMGMIVKPNSYVSDNLVLHYNPSRIESYPGTGTSLTDLTGNGLTGSMSNITYSNATFGFNGTTSQVSIADNPLLEPGSGSWSIEAWFKPTTINGTVIGKYSFGGAGTNISYALRLVGSNAIRADISNGSNVITTDDFIIKANNWVHMVYVWDRTNSAIYTYANGVLKQTKANTSVTSNLNTTTDLYIGSYNGGEYSQYFTGQIGEIRMYKKALSATEVLKNYDASKSNYGVIQSGLVMNLATAPSTGSTWSDISGNSNNATLVNAPTYTNINGGGITTASSAYISTNYNLPSSFTVSVAASFNPSNFWATIWGNESWTAQKGFIAYFLNATNIDFGSASGQVTVPMNDYNTIHIWDFTYSGTTYGLYKDGVLVSTGTFVAPLNGVSANGLYFGARHNNAGTSAQDFGPGTYYSMRVYNRALNADEIKTNFSYLRSTYGL